MHTCFDCGSDRMVKQTGTYSFEVPPNIPGGTMVVEDATWIQCEQCGSRMIPHELSYVLEEMSMKRQGLLLPKEIKVIREISGMTQEAFAASLSFDEKKYKRWEIGYSIQDKASEDKIRHFTTKIKE